MKYRSRGTGLLLAIFISGMALASGQDALIDSCDGCHGENGVSQWSDVPTIAGIDAFSHSEALWVYQDGGRPCGSMCAAVAILSDDDIEAIAAHYATMAFVPAKQDFDVALAEKGKGIHESRCARCHSDGGANPEDEASILAGQWMGYLERTFSEYAAGQREQSAKMKEALEALAAEDITALIHYYASQQ